MPDKILHCSALQSFKKHLLLFKESGIQLSSLELLSSSRWLVELSCNAGGAPAQGEVGLTAAFLHTLKRTIHLTLKLVHNCIIVVKNVDFGIKTLKTCLKYLNKT